MSMAPDFATAASASCQACGTQPLVKFVTRNKITMWMCPNCEMYQNGTLYSPEEYEGAYEDIYAHRLGGKVYTAAFRLNRLAAVLDTKTPKLLEIGCHMGATMEAARIRGWDVTGVDVSKDVVKYCQDKGFKCAAIDGLRLPFPDHSFDAITAWHVIEHVADVRETLAEWRRVLRPGGVMALETPDGSSPKVKRRGANYDRFWRIEHTYVFNPNSLSKMVEETGFEIVEQPRIGRIQEFTATQAAYSLGYLLVETIKQSTGFHKAFQVFGRRVG